MTWRSVNRIVLQILFSVSILLCASCERLTLRRGLSAMYSHSISFQDSVIRIYDKNVTKETLSKRSIPTFIVYIDSAECQSCRISELMKYSDLYNDDKGKVNVVVLFSPSKGNLDHLQSVLSRYNYPFPVYIDPNNTFLKTNPFIPEDRRFRSFMIDREGNVIFVGDPTTSPKLRYLYNRIITNY